MATIIVPPSPGKAVLAVAYNPARKFGCLSHRGTALVYVGESQGVSPEAPESIQMNPNDCLLIRNVGTAYYLVTDALAPQTFTFVTDVL